LSKYLDLQTVSLSVFPRQRSTWYYPGGVSPVSSTQMVQYLSNNISSTFLDFTVTKS